MPAGAPRSIEVPADWSAAAATIAASRPPRTPSQASSDSDNSLGDRLFGAPSSMLLPLLVLPSEFLSWSVALVFLFFAPRILKGGCA